MEIITTAGEALIARKQTEHKPLCVNTFVLAYIPEQDHKATIDRTRGLPDAQHIVYKAPVTQSGYISPNQVVYSLFMRSDVGPFTFNTLYLTCIEDDGTVFAIATVPKTTKIANDITHGTRGTSMTRNFVIAFDGAQAVTHISVPAEAWQFDINQATERQKGLVQLATEVEVNNGTNDEKAVTPKKMKAFCSWSRLADKPNFYPPAQHNHPYVEDVRIGSSEHIVVWNKPVNTYKPGYIITAVGRDSQGSIIDSVQRAPIQKKINGRWYTVASM